MCSCAGKRVKELAVGLVHVLALTESGEVYSWGKQEYAQCGDSPLSDEPRLVSPLCGKTIVGIASGPTQVVHCIIFSLMFWLYKGYLECNRGLLAFVQTNAEIVIGVKLQRKFNHKSCSLAQLL